MCCRGFRSRQKQNETVTNAIAAAATEYARGGYFTIIDGIVGTMVS